MGNKKIDSSLSQDYDPSVVISANSALDECGDVLGEMFHPAFKELAFWKRENVVHFIPTDEEVVHYAIIG